MVAEARDGESGANVGGANVGGARVVATVRVVREWL